MQQPHASSSSPSSRRTRANANASTWHAAKALVSWRLLWAVPAFGALVVMPESPAKWPALALLMASVSVLHADSILRTVRPRRRARMDADPGVGSQR